MMMKMVSRLAGWDRKASKRTGTGSLSAGRVGAAVAACVEQLEGRVLLSTVAVVSNAGGPYVANEGSALTLNGSVSNPGGLALNYSWDVNGDGKFGDATGLNPTLSPAELQVLGLADGPWTVSAVRLRAIDANGGIYDSGATSLTIRNVGPMPKIESISIPRQEGTAITLVGSVKDPGIYDNPTLSWSVYKSNATTSFAAGTGTNFAFTPDDNGQYDVVLVVRDKDNASATQTMSVAVENVAPVVSVLSVDRPSIDENGIVTLSGTVADAGALDTHTVDITWGDGRTSMVVRVDPATRTFSAAHQYLDNQKDDAPYAITVVASDKDGAKSGVTTAEVAVKNVAPTPVIGTVSEARVEGTEIAVSGSASDPGTMDTVSLAWAVYKDGAAEAYASGSGGDFSFMPEDDGEYRIVLTAADEDGGSGVAEQSIVVANAAPAELSLSLSASSIDENGSTVLWGSFFDAGVLDGHTVVVDWGDGSTQTLDLGAGVLSFGGIGHQYLDNRAADAAYAISMSVADTDGAMTTAAADVIVKNVAPSVGTPQGPATAAPGDSIACSISFADVGTLDTHTVQIDWGDGTVSSGSVVESLGSGSGTGSHGYAESGDYTVRFTVTDKDGASESTTALVAVAAPAPAPAVGCGAATTELGTALVVTGSAGADRINITPGKGGVQVSINDLPKVLVLFSGEFGAGGRIVIYGLAGNDSVQVAGAVANPVWIYGDDGDDVLNLGNGGGIAFGGAGNDTLLGGNGRDILVGGRGADRLVGNAGDDVLIGAATVYDDRTEPSHAMAWSSIYAEWNSGRSFGERVADIRRGVLAGGYSFSTMTIAQDAEGNEAEADTLTGASGDDWYVFRSVADRVTDSSLKEGLVELVIDPGTFVQRVVDFIFGGLSRLW